MYYLLSSSGASNAILPDLGYVFESVVLLCVPFCRPPPHCLSHWLPLLVPAAFKDAFHFVLISPPRGGPGEGPD